MNYAIAQIAGKQYILEPGQVITVDKISQKEGEKYDFERILLIRSDDLVLIGTPYIEKAKVTGKIVRQFKGKKIHVRKFKAKIRYRRKIGFRPLLTEVRIENITAPKREKLLDNREKRL